MKKILILLSCVFLLAACEKEMEIVETKDGYEIEKIGTISYPGNYDGEICKEDTYCIYLYSDRMTGMIAKLEMVTWYYVKISDN